MNIIIEPPRSTWHTLVERNTPNDAQVQSAVDDIIAAVRQRGDAALVEYALAFDDTHVDNLALSADEINAGADAVPEALKEAIVSAARNIRTFHQAQMPHEVCVNTANGVRCVQRAVPIRRVGLYIPGGQAPLFSTVLMLAIPAQIAGCSEVTLCTPQSHDKPIAAEILFAARECGIRKIYRVGGAQAVAAMAYGTETIERVDKIFGPGNRYVTKAKQLVSRDTAIDMPAGPSEVLVMADDSANADFVAADLLSQAEHGPDSQAILVCTDATIAQRVNDAVERLKLRLSRASSVESSLSKSRLIVLGNEADMVDFVNSYAPEHLIISMRQPWQIADKIVAAGSVFIGNYSPESVGDYASGTNHTLPTSGWARSYSGVNIDSFMRKITYQELTPAGLSMLAPIVTQMAEAEGLDAHALAVTIRMNNN
jgi:histidinol dehydrogenase